MSQTKAQLIGDLTQALEFITTASTPADGLYLKATNQIALATNSVDRITAGTSELVINESGASVDFRVEGDTNANLLLVDASTDRVGIGTSSPSSRLTVVDSSSNTAGASGAFIDINNTDTTTGVVSGLRFKNGGTDSYKGAIYFEDTAGDARGDLIFATNDVDSGATEVALSDARMTITRSGNVGIGTTSPSRRLHVNSGTTDTAALFESTDADCQINFQDSTSAADGASIGCSGDDFYIRTGLTSTRLTIDSSGRLLVGLTSDSSITTVSLQGRSDSSSQSPMVRFKRGEALPTSGNPLGNIVFSDGQDRTGVEIQATTEANWSASSRPARLGFFFTQTGSSSVTERVRFTQGGTFRFFSSDQAGIRIIDDAAASSSNSLIAGSNSGTGTQGEGNQVFAVRTNGNVQNSNNSYGALSDIKLKENIVDASSQWDDLKAIQVRNYNFKEETGQQTHTQLGVIAQEVELVSPGLVSEAPDTDAEGNDLGTTTKSVNYSVLYMKSVKALQEALGRIETLEAKVAALEAS